PVTSSARPRLSCARLPPFPSSHRPHRALPSFPTRRSSDLRERFREQARREPLAPRDEIIRRARGQLAHDANAAGELLQLAGGVGDRKSTRLNSSHGSISYAVFCLKKKKASRSADSAAPRGV